MAFFSLHFFRVPCALALGKEHGSAPPLLISLWCNLVLVADPVTAFQLASSSCYLSTLKLQELQRTQSVNPENLLVHLAKSSIIFETITSFTAHWCKAVSGLTLTGNDRDFPVSYQKPGKGTVQPYSLSGPTYLQYWFHCYTAQTQITHN
jgi:hypothetical protein